jgi:hypothetical protein
MGKLDTIPKEMKEEDWGEDLKQIQACIPTTPADRHHIAKRTPNLLFCFDMCTSQSS